MTYREHMRQAEREYFTALMVGSRWNHSLAAETAGISRTHMYRMLERNGIKREQKAVVRPNYGWRHIVSP